MDSIKSYVFLDLESSGLPDYDMGKTKITEIAMVACTNEHLLSTEFKDMPRVLHKLTLCINPKKLIDPESSQITNLDNYNLEYENKFDKNVGETIMGFIRHLQQPVCLIAHNGDKFDFPLLQKEFKSIGMAFDDNIQCIDSLKAFQHIKQVVADDEKFTLILQNELNKLNDDMLDNACLENLDFEENIFSDSYFGNAFKDFNYQNMNECTPPRPTISTNIRSKRNNDISKVDVAKLNRINSERARRQLFSQGSTEKNKRLRLVNIFEDTFGRLPSNMHAAEDDAITMLKLAVAWKDYFIPYVEENAYSFKNVPHLGKSTILGFKT